MVICVSVFLLPLLKSILLSHVHPKILVDTKYELQVGNCQSIKNVLLVSMSCRGCEILSNKHHVYFRPVSSSWVLPRREYQASNTKTITLFKDFFVVLLLPLNMNGKLTKIFDKTTDIKRCKSPTTFGTSLYVRVKFI